MFFILLKPGFIIACRPSKHKFFYSVLHAACLFTVSLFPLQRIVTGKEMLRSADAYTTVYVFTIDPFHIAYTMVYVV